MALKADMARQQYVGQPEQVAAELKEIGQTTRQVIREVRRTIFALRPLDWATGGFLPALRRFVLGFAEQVGWQAAIDIDEDGANIPTRLEPTVFRLVQESLNNAAKHAQASKIQLKLFGDQSRRELVIKVRDNGAGFEPAQIEHHGLGLQQMQDRVASVGGKFLVTSAPGQGSQITARIPTTERLS
jgi:signal transduction histidine kinase